MKQIVDLKRVPEREVQRVMDKLVELHDGVWEFLDPAGRDRYFAGLRDLSREESVAILYKSPGGEVVGYNHITVDTVYVNGDPCLVWRSRAGFLPGHRGGNRTFPDAIKYALGYKVARARLPMYMVSFISTPAAYDLMVSVCPTVYPSVGNDDPGSPEAQVLAASVARWGLTSTSPNPKYAVTQLVKAKELPPPRSDSPNVRFFEAATQGCPQPAQLGVCASLSVESLVGGALRTGARMVRRRLR
jgi:hypothetical protein